MVLIDDVTNKIYQINLGDSRSIVFNTVTGIISETEDHKPEGAEATRAVEAGCRITTKSYDAGPARLEGLAMSRALGDFHGKIRRPSTEYNGTYRLFVGYTRYHST